MGRKARTSRRSEFGSVFPTRSQAKSELRKPVQKRAVIGWTAQYSSPIDGRKVTNKFRGDGAERLARAWLDNERDYIETLKRQGRLDEYLNPSERKTAARRRDERADMTYDRYAEQFIEEYRMNGGDRLAPGSVRQLENNLHYSIAAFRGRRLTDIKPRDVGRFLDGEHMGGFTGFNGETVRRNAYKDMKRVMRKATEMGMDGEAPYITATPCTYAAPPVPPSKQAEIPVVTNEQLWKIYHDMPAYTRLAPILAVAVGGMRISEVCALRLCDIDLDKKIVHIRHSLRRGEGDRGKLRLGPTKNRASNASEPIPDAVVPLLREHIAKHTDGKPTTFLFHYRHPDEPIEPNTLRNHFKKAAENAGRPDLHFHTLRATAATAAKNAGASVKDSMALQRHADVKTNVEIYQRSSIEERRALANKIYAPIDAAKDASGDGERPAIATAA
ncbi:tyrosine-type recombinase/integrase [Bifidobacterium leontopitheci]|uniref:Integrase n=1 Tax=Bifidobacterium leontopitheci TaxID=2650774 RepID=A0A6I1GRW5_9BIFI|nr:tyrosine-type recombinase/integrase [Bifidobacterium leontopitheci]KAB7790898.1 integrase [Bifidobacterium leontopitheci]